MDIDWHDLGRAFALYLVLEGLVPFVSPALAQQLFRAMSQAAGGQLRAVGLTAMIGGCVLLFWLRR